MKRIAILSGLIALISLTSCNSKKEEKEVTFSTDDVILLSLQKKDSSTNVIFVTYKNNFNIKNHTLNGYAQILKEILIRNGKNEYPYVPCVQPDSGQ